MTTYVYRNGQVVPKSGADAFAGAAYVLRDEMDATWHPANGRHYDSKSAFRRATRDAGCIEVGDQPLGDRRAPPKLDRRQRADDIRRSIHELRNGR